MQLLVERGAEVYSNPMASYPPVIVAARNDKHSVVEYFLREIPKLAHGTNNLGVTANLAARQGWTDIVRAHIAADPLSVHQRGWIGDTPMHWPAHNGLVEILEILIEAGADFEADEVNCDGGKPLHWASESKPDAVQMLIDRGAQVDSRNVLETSDFHGATPLIMNARQRDDSSEVTTVQLEPVPIYMLRMTKVSLRLRVHWIKTLNGFQMYCGSMVQPISSPVRIGLSVIL